MVKHGYNEVEKYRSGQKNYTYEKTNLTLSNYLKNRKFNKYWH